MLISQKKKLACHLTSVLSLLAIACLVAMILFGIHAFRPPRQEPYKNTRCTVLGQTMNGTMNCTCMKDKDKKESNLGCESSYPCVIIQVFYLVDNGTASENVSSSLLDDQTIDSEDDEIELEERRKKPEFNPQQCSYIPMCMEDASKNNQSVERYIDMFGSPGKEYGCFYDPKDYSYVKVWPFERSLKKVTILFYIALALFVLSFVGSLMSLKCYKKLAKQDQQDTGCPCKPPPEKISNQVTPLPPLSHHSTVVRQSPIVQASPMPSKDENNPPPYTPSPTATTTPVPLEPSFD